MPSAPMHPCSCSPGCQVLLPAGVRRCTDDGKTKVWQRTNAPIRIRGRQLQGLRQMLFQRQPLCVLCEAKGIVRMATIRDHIIPLAEDGPDVDANTQALCQSCSDVKTAEEAKRGAARHR